MLEYMLLDSMRTKYQLTTTTLFLFCWHTTWYVFHCVASCHYLDILWYFLWILHHQNVAHKNNLCFSIFQYETWHPWIWKMCIISKLTPIFIFHWCTTSLVFHGVASCLNLDMLCDFYPSNISHKNKSVCFLFLILNKTPFDLWSTSYQYTTTDFHSFLVHNIIYFSWCSIMS